MHNHLYGSCIHTGTSVSKNAVFGGWMFTSGTCPTNKNRLLLGNQNVAVYCQRYMLRTVLIYKCSNENDLMPKARTRLAHGWRGVGRGQGVLGLYQCTLVPNEY